MARKHSLGLLLVLVSITLIAVACGSTSPASVRAGEARSDRARITNPDVPETDVAEVARGNNTFAFELYEALRESEDGNLMFSPYSISTALAMTYAGARGDTEAEMAQTLHFLAQDRLHPALNALDLGLAPRAEQAPEGGDPLQLDIANSVWGQRDYDFASAYLDTLALYYGAGLRLVNFAEDPDGSRRAINDWVSDQTQERIPELFPEGVIDRMTRLVLANAIFFKASWAFPFDQAATRDGPFFLLNGSEVRVPMMSFGEEATLAYARLDGAQAVALPYLGQASMLLIVPDEGEFESFEASLDAEALDAVTESLQRYLVELSMPKFEFESAFSLSKTLKELGMPLAFGAADFSGMNASGERGLFISEVVHKANITVDERGTEAAAATGVAVADSLPPGPVRLTIDQPFIFVIQDSATGAILFAGRVLNPAAS